MKKMRQAVFACTLFALVVATTRQGTLTDELIIIASMLLIILVAVPLGSFAIYLLARAVRLAGQLWMYPSKRRADAQWSTEQHIAELEAATGHGVVREGACPSCHAALVMHARFCSMCGSKVSGEDASEVIVCHACHQANPAEGRFCWQCGQRLHQPVS